MNWNIFKNIELSVWYRGFKVIKVKSISSNKIVLTNNDIITLNSNELYFNDKLISTLSDITEEEIYELYLIYLKNKKYKFL